MFFFKRKKEEKQKKPRGPPVLKVLGAPLGDFPTVTSSTVLVDVSSASRARASSATPKSATTTQVSSLKVKESGEPGVTLSTEHRGTDGTYVQIHNLRCSEVLTAKTDCYEQRISQVVRALFHGYSGAILVTGDPTAKYALTGLAGSKSIHTNGGFTFFPNIVPKALAEILQGARECMDLEAFNAQQRGKVLKGTFFRLSFQAFLPTGASAIYDLQERRRSKTPPPQRTPASSQGKSAASPGKRPPSPLQGDRPPSPSPSSSPARPSAPPQPTSSQHTHASSNPRGGTVVGLELTWDILPTSDLQKIEDSLVNHLDRAIAHKKASDPEPDSPMFLVWRLTRVWGSAAEDAPGKEPSTPRPDPAGESESSVYFTLVDLPCPHPESDARSAHALRSQALALEQVLQAVREGREVVPFRLSPATELLGRFLPANETKVALVLALARENRTNKPFPSSLGALKHFGYLSGEHATCVEKALQYNPAPPANFRPRESAPSATWGAGRPSSALLRSSQPLEGLARRSFTGRAPSPSPLSRASTTALPRVQPRPRAASAFPLDRDRSVVTATTASTQVKREEGLRMRRELEEREQQRLSYSRPRERPVSPSPSRHRPASEMGEPGPSKPFMLPTLAELQRNRDTAAQREQLKQQQSGRAPWGTWKNSWARDSGSFSPANNPTQVRAGPSVDPGSGFTHISASGPLVEQTQEWTPKARPKPERHVPSSTLEALLSGGRPTWNMGTKAAPSTRSVRAVSAPRVRASTSALPLQPPRASTPDRRGPRASVHSTLPARASWADASTSSPARGRPSPFSPQPGASTPPRRGPPTRNESWAAPSPGNEDLAAQESRVRKSNRYSYVRSSGYGQPSPSASPARTRPTPQQPPEFGSPAATRGGPSRHPTVPGRRVAPIPIAGWASHEPAASTEASPRDIALSHPAYREARQPIDPESPTESPSPPPKHLHRPSPLAGLPPSALATHSNTTGSPSFGTKSGSRLSGSPTAPRSVTSKRAGVVSFPVADSGRDRENSDDFSFPSIMPSASSDAALGRMGSRDAAMLEDTREASFSAQSPSAQSPDYTTLSRTQPNLFSEDGHSSLVVDGGTLSPPRTTFHEASEGPDSSRARPKPLPIPLSQAGSPESNGGGSASKNPFALDPALVVGGSVFSPPPGTSSGLRRDGFGGQDGAPAPLPPPASAVDTLFDPSPPRMASSGRAVPLPARSPLPPATMSPSPSPLALAAPPNTLASSASPGPGRPSPPKLRLDLSKVIQERNQADRDERSSQKAAKSKLEGIRKKMEEKETQKKNLSQALGSYGGMHRLHKQQAQQAFLAIATQGGSTGLDPRDQAS